MTKMQNLNNSSKNEQKLDDEQERKIKKAKREYENFMTYSGDEQ